MVGGSHLLATVALGLVSAFVGGLVAERLRLPVVIGYLAAGTLLGPFTPGMVIDTALAPELAEIGVVLMMFGVGLHFSIADLLALRRISLPGAVLQMALATAAGAVLGRLWGWPLGGSLVFGLSLSCASTVVLTRNLGAVDRLEGPDGRVAVAWLLVEDLVCMAAIVLVPLLAAMPSGGAAAGSGAWALLTAAGRFAVFLGVMLIVGRRALTWLLRQSERGGTELFTIAVAAVAIGVAVAAAELFGASYALGAFLAGLVINEADLTHRAARQVRPLEAVFVAMFFVAVGMLFDPAIVLREPLRLAAVLAIVLVWKSLVAYVVVRVLRQSDRTARVIAAALAQIGEFSFVLATLAWQLGLLDREALTLVVAGALLSIMANPLAFLLLTGLRPVRGPTGVGEAP